MKEYTNIIFDISKMKDNEEKAFKIPEDSTIHFGAAILGRKLITSIKFRKVIFEGKDERLFIEAFAGHITVATIVDDIPYTLVLGDDNYFVIGPTEEYDYISKKGQKNKPL
jgi:hypothetical protein